MRAYQVVVFDVPMVANEIAGRLIHRHRDEAGLRAGVASQRDLSMPRQIEFVE